MITTVVPGTWDDLQVQVARILIESGFAVEVEKKIATVRGEVEIDVYAEESIRGRRYVILCECKHWKKAIPQNTVHGFRTVVADTGAHIGYIISPKGFQKGSFSAAELTNIELITWEEFQEKFDETWLVNYFSPVILKELDGLMTYAEPFVPLWLPELSRLDQKEFFALKEKHEELGWLLQSLAMHPITRRREPFPKLPLADSFAKTFDMSKVPESISKPTGYRQVLDAALDYGGKALGQFRALRDKATAKGGTKRC